MASIINAATSGGLVTTADTSGILQLQTAGTTAVTVNASQNMGVGTASPTARLQVDGTTDATQRVLVGGTGNTSSYKLNYNGSEVAQFQNYQSSEVSIGSTSNAFLALVTNNTEKARIPAAGGIQSKTTISVGDATPSSSGAGITFPATQSASTNANTLDDYQEGSFTGTLTGCTTSPTGTIYYTKVGNVVTVNLRYIVGTSNTTALTITGVPTELRSVSGEAYMLVVVYDNGVAKIGQLDSTTSTIWTFHSGLDGSNPFTASGSKGPSYTAFSYTTN